MRLCNVCLFATILLLMMFSVDSVQADDFTVAREPVAYTPPPDSPTNAGKATYDGTLRVYIVEPESRWKDAGNHPYEYGFLDWGLITGISIPDASLWETTVSWDASDAGYASVEKINIMAQVVVFNSSGHTEDACPGYGPCYFTAYDADAAAAAIPGFPGINETATGFTHTVFLEEGTRTT